MKNQAHTLRHPHCYQSSSRTGTPIVLGALCVVLCLLAAGVAWAAQLPKDVSAVASSGVDAGAQAGGDYVVGPQDVLMIASFDQATLSGKFTVETDGTFSFPLIGRVKAGTLTLRQVEAELKKQLREGGFFINPQVTVAVETYRSQKVFIVGEVRTPGTYPLSGGMSLVEALARAGSTLPTSSGDAIIVHADPTGRAGGPIMPTQVDPDKVVRVDLRALERGEFSQNTALRDGDTIFLPRAESLFVSGEVRNPGSYPLPQRETTVLQALSLAGGMTEYASRDRIQIIRIEQGVKKEIRAKLSDVVQPGDTIVVPERNF